MNSPEYNEPVENFIDVPDGKIHFLDWGGTGPQAHLLHANGFCAGTYSPFVKHLTDHLHVMASDIRGHGASQFPSSQRIRHWNIFAEDLKGLIEKAMAPPIIGMGHSLDIEHGHNCSVVFRQGEKSFVQFFLKFVNVTLSSWIGAMALIDEGRIILETGFIVIEAQAGSPSPLFEEVQRHVGRD